MIYAQVTDERLKFLEKELKATKGVKWYRLTEDHPVVVSERKGSTTG